MLTDDADDTKSEQIAGEESVEQPLSTAESEELDRMATSYLNEMRIKAVEDAFSPFGQKLQSPGRALIGQGKLTKVCKKRPKKRAFFLFSDILVYGGVALKKPTKKYNGQQILPLHKMKVEPIPDAGDLKNAFAIYTPKKSFTLLANSPKERDEWISHLRKCAIYCSNAPDDNAEANDDIIGASEITSKSAAPVWISDSHANGCMICSKKFTLVYRRHHCRNCGSVICADCSKNKFLLANISNKEPQRVCDLCFEKLNKSPDGALKTSSLLPSYNTSDSSEDESDNEEQQSLENIANETVSIRAESVFYEEKDDIEQ